jgi:hypothetical protein
MVCETSAYVSAVVSVLAVGAPVSDRRRRRHLFLFDHIPHFIDNPRRFSLSLRRKLEYHGIALWNQVNKSAGHFPLIATL